MYWVKSVFRFYDGKQHCPGMSTYLETTTGLIINTTDMIVYAGLHAN